MRLNLLTNYQTRLLNTILSGFSLQRYENTRFYRENKPESLILVNKNQFNDFKKHMIKDNEYCLKKYPEILSEILKWDYRRETIIANSILDDDYSGDRYNENQKLAYYQQKISKLQYNEPNNKKIAEYKQDIISLVMLLETKRIWQKLNLSDYTI